MPTEAELIAAWNAALTEFKNKNKVLSDVVKNARGVLAEVDFWLGAEPSDISGMHPTFSQWPAQNHLQNAVAQLQTALQDEHRAWYALPATAQMSFRSSRKIR